MTRGGGGWVEGDLKENWNSVTSKNYRFFIIVNKEQKLAQDWRIIYHNRMKFINHVENIVYVNLDFLGAFVLEKKKKKVLKIF